MPNGAICGFCKHRPSWHVPSVNSHYILCVICSCRVKEDSSWIINSERNLTMPMSQTRADNLVKQSYVRLNPAMDELRQVVFYDSKDLKLLFFGSTVRDSLAGGLVNNFDVLIVDEIEVNTYFKNLIQKDISTRFVREADDNDEEENFIGKYKFSSKFGPKTFSLWIDKIPEFYWLSDIATFNGKVHYKHKYLLDIIATKQLDLVDFNRVNNTNYEKILLEGAKIATQYGWNISNHSMGFFNKIIEDSKPLPEITDSLIVGFRIFAVRNGKLTGYHSTAWDTEQLTAICDQGQLVKHLKSTDFDRGEHGCGIYIYKDAAEAMNEYKSDAVALVMGWGNAFEGERGWRVEHCRIDKLWIWNPNNRPDRGQYDIKGGIILGAKQGDFYREIYSSGYDFDNTHSRW